jgi:hypothetical protein
MNMTRKATKKRPTRKAVKTTKKNSAGKARAEGLRLFALAGRPTKQQLVLAYGKRGPLMTWGQRSAVGIPAEKFQAVLAAKQAGR